MRNSIPALHVLLAVVLMAASQSAIAEEAPTPNDRAADQQVEKPEKTQTVSVANNQLQLELPARWKQVERRSRIIELEFSVPAKQEGEEDARTSEQQPTGRLTMMSAGGDVEANMERWKGQFQVGQNADGEEAVERKRLEVDSAIVHTLDIAGTFFDTPRGPFGPKVERPGYRMLAAIIEAEGVGKYFIKFYGPESLVASNAKAFQNMLESIEVTSAGAESRGTETTPEP